MPQFDNIDGLLRYVQKQINDTLKDEVTKNAKDVMAEAIEDTVYDAYSPSVYSRRYTHGGLLDKDFISATSVQRGEAVVLTNEAPLSSGYPNSSSGMALDEIIVSGNGYDFTRYGYAGYEKPRDFYEATYDKLNKSKEHIQAMKDGLKKRGLECD